MATLSGLSSPFQLVGSSTRVNTAQLVNNYARANVRVTSWLEQYLKQQQEEAAEKKAAEEAAAAEQAAAEQAAAEQAATEQAAAEQAAFETQKQAYMESADIVVEFESGYLNLTNAEGVDANANMFIDVTANYGTVLSGEGDDVFYFSGNQNYFGDDIAKGYYDGMLAFGNGGDDKFFGGDGTQTAIGGLGNDLIDLGNGYDILLGGANADEFVIDLQDSGFDLIGDFVDVGDKITIYNGGQLAQADDWMLVSVGSEWTGLYPPSKSYNCLFESGNQFYEIQSADGETAARFSGGINTFTGFTVKYQLTVQQGVAGLEVIESDHGYSEAETSVEFI